MGRPRRSTRNTVAADRAHALPSRSRLTVRRSARAPLAHSVRLGEALRASREALADIQHQLDALLKAVRAPDGQPANDAPDRLRLATRRAGSAFDRLTDL